MIQMIPQNSTARQKAPPSKGKIERINTPNSTQPYTPVSSPHRIQKKERKKKGHPKRPHFLGELSQDTTSSTEPTVSLASLLYHKAKQKKVSVGHSFFTVSHTGTQHRSLPLRCGPVSSLCCPSYRRLLLRRPSGLRA